MSADKLAYTIRRACVDDRDNINMFMHTHFFIHEPLNMSLGIPRGHKCTEGSLAMFCLPEGHCLLAVTLEHGVEVIVGVALIGESTSTEDDFVMDPAKCAKHKKLFKFIMKVYDDSDMWTKTGLTRALDLHVLSVDSSLRRHGIARALVDETIKMARDEGWPMVMVMCTSHFSASLMENLGWKCLYEVRYDSYLDESGLPLFNPPLPHEGVKCFAFLLDGVPQGSILAPLDINTV